MTERPSEIKARPEGSEPEGPTAGAPKLKSPKLGGQKPTAPRPEKSSKIHPLSFDRPVARPAQIKPRHRGLILSLALVIALPVLLTTIYLTVFAQPQYASQVGFTIRQEETGNASDLMGGLSGLLGSPVQGNADLLFEYVQSQEIVERIDAGFDLIAHYSETWPLDPVFSIWPSALIEDAHWFWNRMVRLTYDKATGMMLVQVRARDPASAQQLAQLIVSESELMINRLNEAARRDTTRNAEADLDAALERLRSARQALSEFRARTQILDPQGYSGSYGRVERIAATTCRGTGRK